MKTLHKTLLMTVMLAAPFAAAQAHDTDAAHRAWLKAQQIDIKPTLTITETEIPADTSKSSSTPSSSPTPSSTMPSSSGTYSPGIQPSSTPRYPAPIENHPGMNSGMGTQAK